MPQAFPLTPRLHPCLCLHCGMARSRHRSSPPTVRPVSWEVMQPISGVSWWRFSAGILAHGFGRGLGGGVFCSSLSGCIGFGFGDMALSGPAPPRTPSQRRRSIASPREFAAAIEWALARHASFLVQSLCGVLILAAWRSLCCRNAARPPCAALERRGSDLESSPPWDRAEARC